MRDVTRQTWVNMGTTSHSRVSAAESRTSRYDPMGIVGAPQLGPDGLRQTLIARGHHGARAGNASESPQLAAADVGIGGSAG